MPVLTSRGPLWAGALAIGCLAGAAAGGNVDLPRAPAVSPDGSTLTFTWRGDIWIAPMAGGQAVRLTSHPATELRSAWLPDGSAIIFDSDRMGGRNLFIVNADGSDVRQITNMDGGLVLSGVHTMSDGTVAIFVDASVENDLFRSGRPYWLPVEGGELRRVHGAFGSSPALSPDGTRVLFERGGSATNRRGYRGSDQRDIWMFDMRAEPEKAFTQLTTWEGNDWSPCWVDNDSFVYLSDRELNTQNVYRQAAKPGAAPTRLTDFDRDDCASLSVSADGKTAAVLNWDTIYRIALDKPGSKPVALKFSASEDMGDGAELRNLTSATTEAALSPDGKTMAMIAYGDVWVRPLEGRASARRVTASAAREKDITWTADGHGLLFTTDEGGRESIMMATVTATRGDLAKNLTDAMTPPPPPPPPAEPAPEPAAPADPAAAAPATDPAPAPAPAPAPEPPATPAPAPAPAPEPPPAPAPPASPNPTSDDALEQDPPPAAPAPAPTPAAPAPAPAAPAPAPAPAAEPAPAPPAAPAPSPAPAKPEPAKPEPPKPDPARWADAVRFQVEPFISHPDQHVREAAPSPDNSRIAYRRGRGDIMVMDIGTRASTLLITGWDPAIDMRWSPDSKFIAYAQDDRDNNRDVWIVPSDGSAPAMNITRHPDNDRSPRWSADGKMMAFLSERNNNESDVFVVMLDKSLEGLQSVEREKYFKDATEAARKRKPPAVRDWNPPKPPAPSDETADDASDAPAADALPADDAAAAPAAADAAPATDAKPADAATAAAADSKPEAAKGPWDPSWSLDDAYLRVKRVTSLLGPEGDLEMLPSGENIIFGGNGSSGSGLYTSKWDGTGQRKISARVSVRGLNFAGDQIVGVTGGKACLVPVGGTGGANDGTGRTIDVDATIRVDLAKLYEQKFLEAMRLMGENFYHPTMKDLDWNEITQRYLELAKRSRTASEFDSVANRALGELNASHMGIRSPGGGSPLAQSQGRLGVRTENVPEGLRVTFIMPESPAALARNPLRVGDIITHVDEAPATATSTLDSMMAGTTGRETWLTITRTFEDGRTASFDVSFEPTSGGTIGALAYNATRLRAAQLVDEWSGGRVGYLHIQGMNQPSLDEFERDLFAAANGKEGLIIDVRNNGGGWTADRLLASIMAPRHAYTVPRGADPAHTNGYPQDRLFIQRFSMPINMLCNEKSFSNAEIVSHAFKTLKRGTLVGMPTYGGVISTGSASLLDGTTVRMPTRGWYLLDGTDMENNGAVPDVIVPQTPEAEAASRDDQLKAAVDNLLSRLPVRG